MIRNFVVNKYLAKEFFKITINTSLTFFCLGFVLNLFEEINFFKDLEVGINIPIILSVLLSKEDVASSNINREGSL